MNMSVCSEIIRCANFAAMRHSTQRRKDPEQTPYINHPIGVAHILTAEGGVDDLTVIQAALLHDTVEDTDTTFEEIEQHFGKAVANVVREVTDDKSLPKSERKRLQVEHAPSASHEAKLVKLADKLYNIRDMRRVAPVGHTEERIQEYYHWTKRVVSGLAGTNEKLETLIEDFLESAIK